MSNEIKIGLAILVIAFLIERLVNHVEETFLPTAKLIEERAEVYADEDHNGIISPREFENVYKRTGVSYNPERPERLTTYHFRKFVRFYSKR